MLSNKGKYAIRSLILLANNIDSLPLNASQVADLGRFPKKYLEGILLELVNAGYLISKKGTRGGYSLRKPATEIFLVDVVRCIDGPIARVSCVSKFHYHKCEECIDEATCSIKKLYFKVWEQELKILSNTTIAEMAYTEQLFSLPQLIIT
jgi:Rrf2 family protein